MYAEWTAKLLTARAGRRHWHWLHTGLNSSPSSPTLSSSDPDDQYIYSPPSVEFDPVVGFSPRPRSLLSSLPSVTTTEAPTDTSSGLPVASIDQDPLVYAYKIFASPTPVPTSTFTSTTTHPPVRPSLRHLAAKSELGSPEDKDQGNGYLTAEPYRRRRYSFSSVSSRSRSSSNGSGSSSPSSSEGCITPEDELTEDAANVYEYVRARTPPTDGDNDVDEAELEWGRNEDVEVADAEWPVDVRDLARGKGRSTCGNGAADIEERDLFAPPVAPKPSPRMPSHDGKWGCELEHHDGAVGGMVGMTPKMATSHVLHYAVQMLHVFPPEPARRWM